MPTPPFFFALQLKGTSGILETIFLNGDVNMGHFEGICLILEVKSCTKHSVTLKSILLYPRVYILFKYHLDFSKLYHSRKLDFHEDSKD